MVNGCSLGGDPGVGSSTMTSGGASAGEWALERSERKPLSSVEFVVPSPEIILWERRMGSLIAKVCGGASWSFVVRSLFCLCWSSSFFSLSNAFLRRSLRLEKDLDCLGWRECAGEGEGDGARLGEGLSSWFLLLGGDDG